MYYQDNDSKHMALNVRLLGKRIGILYRKAVEPMTLSTEFPKMDSSQPLFFPSSSQATDHFNIFFFLERGVAKTDRYVYNEVGTPDHYVTSCPLTKAWHMRLPDTDIPYKRLFIKQTA
ncbi:hypothetical protein X975_21255, partial [Stegodyphus mimosarum]